MLLSLSQSPRFLSENFFIIENDIVTWLPVYALLPSVDFKPHINRDQVDFV